MGLNSKKSISFLLGSGFSYPAEVPGVDKINEKLIELNAANFYTDSIGYTHFQKNNGTGLDWIEKASLIELIDFYKRILENDKDFNYEKFYDFLLDSKVEFNKGKGKIFKFIEEFKANHKNVNFSGEAKYIIRIVDLFEFSERVINQLVEFLLYKTEFNIEGYEKFIFWIKKLATVHDLQIHTLNHDLLFEYIISQNSLDPLMLARACSSWP